MNRLERLFNAIYMSPEPGEGGGGGDPDAGDPPVGDPPVGDPPVGDPPADPPKAFYEALPETWRDEVVGLMGLEDGADKDKLSTQLGRVPDFKTFTKNYFSAQDKIRSGQIDKGLPENPTDEQLSAYREANDIPGTAEEYSASLDEGLVLNEADERIMGSVYEVAHKNNLSNDAMNDLTNAMLVGRQAEQDLIIQQDGVDKQTSTSMVKETWGADYQTNVNMVQGLVNTLPESVRDDFANARLADGTALFNSPEALVFFADVARTMNPSGTVVPNSNNPTLAITEELKALEDRMGTDEWFKDEPAQKRYRDLLEAQDRMAQ
jgi:hypothetical protein